MKNAWEKEDVPLNSAAVYNFARNGCVSHTDNDDLCAQIYVVNLNTSCVERWIQC